jgi:hypothetical protein
MGRGSETGHKQSSGLFMPDERPVPCTGHERSRPPGALGSRKAHERLQRVGTATWHPERADIAKHLAAGAQSDLENLLDRSFPGSAVTSRGGSRRAGLGGRRHLPPLSE